MSAIIQQWFLSLDDDPKTENYLNCYTGFVHRQPRGGAFELVRKSERRAFGDGPSFGPRTRQYPIGYSVNPVLRRAGTGCWAITIRDANGSAIGE